MQLTGIDGLLGESSKEVASRGFGHHSAAGVQRARAVVHIQNHFTIFGTETSSQTSLRGQGLRVPRPVLRQQRTQDEQVRLDGGRICAGMKKRVVIKHMEECN